MKPVLLNMSRGARPYTPVVGVPPLGGRNLVAPKTQPPKGGTPTSSDAFSLMEVVIAVAIFAMAATVLTSAFTNALLSRERSVSHDLINNDIRAVRLQLLLEANLDDAEDGDDMETLSSGEASWEAVIEPTNVIDLFRVQLNISFSEPAEGIPKDYTETLYLLRPTWSESSEREDLLQDKRDDLEDTRRDIDF